MKKIVFATGNSSKGKRFYQRKLTKQGNYTYKKLQLLQVLKIWLNFIHLHLVLMSGVIKQIQLVYIRNVANMVATLFATLIKKR